MTYRMRVREGVSIARQDRGMLTGGPAPWPSLTVSPARGPGPSLPGRRSWTPALRCLVSTQGSRAPPPGQTPTGLPALPHNERRTSFVLRIRCTQRMRPRARPRTRRWHVSRGANPDHEAREARRDRGRPAPGADLARASGTREPALAGDAGAGVRDQPHSHAGRAETT